jgi:uncharacterized membrane protein YfcA
VLGGALVSRIPAKVFKWTVIGFAFAISAYYLWRALIT